MKNANPHTHYTYISPLIFLTSQLYTLEEGGATGGSQCFKWSTGGLCLVMVGQMDKTRVRKATLDIIQKCKSINESLMKCATTL